MTALLVSVAYGGQCQWAGTEQVEKIERKSESGRVVVDLRICPDPYCDSDKRAHFMCACSLPLRSGSRLLISS